MRFRLTPRSMTLDDLELNKFKFSENLSGSQISDATTAKQMKIDQYCQRQRCVSTSNWSNFWHACALRGFVSDSWAFLLFNTVELLGIVEQAHSMTTCGSSRPRITCARLSWSLSFWVHVKLIHPSINLYSLKNFDMDTAKSKRTELDEKDIRIVSRCIINISALLIISTQGIR